MEGAFFLASIAVAIIVGTRAGFGTGCATFFGLFALIVAIRSTSGGDGR